MAFGDFVNRRLDGESTVEQVEAEVTQVTAPIISIVPESTEPPIVPMSIPEGENYAEAAKSKKAERYSEDELLRLLGRMQKGSTFMLEHLYDERGQAKLDDFISVTESLYNMVVAYRAVGILNAESA